MHQDDRGRLAGEIIQLLDREAEVLRASAFEALEPLVQDKLYLMSRALAAELDEGAASSIQRHAQRNAALLEGTMQGMRAAIRRIDLLCDPSRATSTYDGSGRRSNLTPPPASAERRA